MIRATVFSHIGNSREVQEDNYLLGEGRFLSPEVREAMGKSRRLVTEERTFSGDAPFLVAVSDGMGGQSCGEVASLTTVQYLSGQYGEILKNARDMRALQESVARLNENFCRQAERRTEGQDMGATLCGVVYSGRDFHGFNVGDSRLYLFAEDELRQLSVDQTEGQRLLGLGLLTETELPHFPKRKALYNYIGRRSDLRPDFIEIPPMTQGMTLLLCSDGLTDALEDYEIEAVFRNRSLSPRQVGSRLVEEAVAKYPGQGDNITVILITLGEGK